MKKVIYILLIIIAFIVGYFGKTYLDGINIENVENVIANDENSTIEPTQVELSEERCRYFIGDWSSYEIEDYEYKKIISILAINKDSVTFSIDYLNIKDAKASMVGNKVLYTDATGKELTLIFGESNIRVIEDGFINVFWHKETKELAEYEEVGYGESKKVLLNKNEHLIRFEFVECDDICANEVGYKAIRILFDDKEIEKCSTYIEQLDKIKDIKIRIYKIYDNYMKEYLIVSHIVDTNSDTGVSYTINNIIDENGKIISRLLISDSTDIILHEDEDFKHNDSQIYNVWNFNNIKIYKDRILLLDVKLCYHGDRDVVVKKEIKIMNNNVSWAEQKTIVIYTSDKFDLAGQS